MYLSDTQALGEARVRGGCQGNLRDLPAGPGHLEGQALQDSKQAGQWSKILIKQGQNFRKKTGF